MRGGAPFAKCGQERGGILCRFQARGRRGTARTPSRKTRATRTPRGVDARRRRRLASRKYNNAPVPRICTGRECRLLATSSWCGQGSRRRLRGHVPCAAQTAARHARRLTREKISLASARPLSRRARFPRSRAKRPRFARLILARVRPPCVVGRRLRSAGRMQSQGCADSWHEGVVVLAGCRAGQGSLRARRVDARRRRGSAPWLYDNAPCQQSAQDTEPVRGLSARTAPPRSSPGRCDPTRRAPAPSTPPSTAPPRPRAGSSPRPPGPPPSRCPGPCHAARPGNRG